MVFLSVAFFELTFFILAFNKRILKIFIFWRLMFLVFIKIMYFKFNNA